MQIKAFFTLVFFLLVLATLVFGSMSNNDLTPDTPPAPPQTSFFEQTVPITNTFTGQSVQPGWCGPVHTVRSGDTLSSIARACGVPLASLIAANPTISNPHLIWPGQVIAVPVGGAAQPQAVPQTVPDSGANAQTIIAAPRSAEPAGIPSGLVPGGMIHAQAHGLPPNTEVTVGVGKAGTIPMHVDKGVTDAEGRLNVTVAIPKRAKSGEAWQISFITEKRPFVEVASLPFVIE